MRAVEIAQAAAGPRIERRSSTIRRRRAPPRPCRRDGEKNSPTKGGDVGGRIAAQAPGDAGRLVELVGRFEQGEQLQAERDSVGGEREELAHHLHPRRGVGGAGELGGEQLGADPTVEREAAADPWHVFGGATAPQDLALQVALHVALAEQYVLYQ